MENFTLFSEHKETERSRRFAYFHPLRLSDSSPCGNHPSAASVGFPGKPEPDSAVILAGHGGVIGRGVLPGLAASAHSPASWSTRGRGGKGSLGPTFNHEWTPIYTNQASHCLTSRRERQRQCSQVESGRPRGFSFVPCWRNGFFQVIGGFHRPRSTRESREMNCPPGELSRATRQMSREPGAMQSPPAVEIFRLAIESFRSVKWARRVARRTRQRAGGILRLAK